MNIDLTQDVATRSSSDTFDLGKCGSFWFRFAL